MRRTALVLAVIAAAGCKTKEAPKALPPEVLVTPVTQKDVPVGVEAVGQTRGSEEVEIRPRISGALESINNGGRIKQSYALSLARRDEAVAQYLKATQSAFRETSDAFIATQKYGQVRTAAEAQTAALKEAARLAHVRYDGGLSNYLEVLDADRRYFQAQNELAQVLGAQAVSYVTLYRVLGGGWNADSVPVR